MSVFVYITPKKEFVDQMREMTQGVLNESDQIGNLTSMWLENGTQLREMPAKEETNPTFEFGFSPITNGNLDDLRDMTRPELFFEKVEVPSKRMNFMSGVRI